MENLNQAGPDGRPALPPEKRFPINSTAKWKKGLIAAAIILPVSGIIMALNFDLFLRIVALAGTLLFIFSIAAMLLTFRKSKKISPGALAISMATSLVTLWVYAFFLGFHLTSLTRMLAMLCGAMIGVGWALTTPARLNNGIVERAGNLWYLVVWAAIFALNQLITILTGKPPQVAMILLMFGTGTVIGNSVTLIAMFYKIKAGTAEIEK